jgi:predicted type IV restriction endonuclease
MSNVPSRVVELIETFDRGIEAYHSSQYNETQIRREFIEPFLEELGWDVTNKAGNAHGGWPIK